MIRIVQSFFKEFHTRKPAPFKNTIRNIIQTKDKLYFDLLLIDYIDTKKQKRKNIGSNFFENKKRKTLVRELRNEMKSVLSKKSERDRIL